MNQESFSLEVISRKSWVSYAKAAIPVIIFALIGNALYESLPKIAVTFISLAILYFVYQIVELRSVKLIVSPDGVFYEAGAFPWNSGSVGVKWDELDNAFFSPGFLSWLFHSYTICTTHKFSRANIFVATNMSNGNEAVIAINELKSEYLAHQRAV